MRHLDSSKVGIWASMSIRLCFKHTNLLAEDTSHQCNIVPASGFLNHHLWHKAVASCYRPGFSEVPAICPSVLWAWKVRELGLQRREILLSSPELVVASIDRFIVSLNNSADLDIGCIHVAAVLIGKRATIRTNWGAKANLSLTKYFTTILDVRIWGHTILRISKSLVFLISMLNHLFELHCSRKSSSSTLQPA